MPGHVRPAPRGPRVAVGDEEEEFLDWDEHVAHVDKSGDVPMDES